MTVYDYVITEFPQFAEYVAHEGDWYREFNYGVASRALDFAIDLKRGNDEAELQRLFRHIEAGMSREDVENALCLDFIQRVSDIASQFETDFVLLMGPKSRACYDMQHSGVDPL